jgi:hypothetical protein
MRGIEEGKGYRTMTHSRDLRLVAVLALVSVLAGCGTLVPAEGPSKLAQRPKIDSGPSAQRLGPDGYPLLGAFPKSAATQLPEPTVVAERNSLKATATVQNTGAGTAGADYQRSLAEAAALRAETRRKVDAAVANGAGTGTDAEASSEEILRQIEGR